MIFILNTVQSEIGKRSTKFKGSKLWNDLPTDIKEIKSYSYFKFKIKDYLIHLLD